MNKKIFSYMTLAAMTVAGLSSCSDEQTLAVGEGTMFISTRVNSDIRVESRAEGEVSDELAASTKVWVYSEEGVVRKYNSMSELPAEGLKLLTGNYTIKAWAGKLSYASFNDRWFEGQEDVVIEAGKTTSVTVDCKIANVVASVSYPEGIDEHISNYSMTISHKGGSLTFEGNVPDKKGYFMMPEGVSTLDYVLTFTANGEQKEKRGTIADVQPAHHYVLNVTTNPGESENNGAAFIEIVVDETTVDVANEIVITTPPEITGYGFDINTPLTGESGTLGRRSVYVASASPLKRLILTGIPKLDVTDVDFIRATDEVLSTLRAAGIYHEVTEQGDARLVKIVFEDTFINALENSETPYVIGISATDSSNKTTTANLTLRVTEAPITIVDIPEEAKECYHTQTLKGTIEKDNVEAAGFEYAVEDTDDWQYVEGHAESRATFVKGQTFTATLTDLALGTRYKYRAVAGTATEITYRSEELSFETGTPGQLPNAGFENWSAAGSGSKAAMVPMPAGQDFWDSGNHGSAGMGVNLTQQDTEIKHGGNSSARLRSQFVGVGGLIGAFAAGNIFTGKFIGIEGGTNGIVGFGRPFTFPTRELKPVAIKLWVKYITSNNWKGNSNHKPASGYDEGHIFTALFDGPDNGDEANEEGQYGFVVHTMNSSRLFDKNASNVIAYGEHIFTENTAGDGLIELTIPYEYYASKAGAQPTHIAVVCTASRYGDYFQGGDGATMYVDDVEIIYGAK